jgi:pimeloyl-ACP methyl ester carboxylesterase
MTTAVVERRINVSGVVRRGLPIEYLTAGEGPPLILLHGVADSAYTWQWVIPALARTHRVYAPSLPGFGNSAKPDVDYTPAFFTTFVSKFMNTLNLERASVVGNSLGGLIAMRLALAQPMRVSSLGIVDSAGLGRDITLLMRLLTLPGIGRMVTIWNKTAIGAWQWAFLVSALLFAHPTDAPKTWVRELSWMARLPGYLDATVATVRGGGTLKGQREDEILLDLLPSLTMPTLVVWGDRDRVVPVRHAYAAMENLPNGYLSLFPDCGHLPHIERAEQFAKVLQRFLREQDVLPMASAK